MVHGVHEKVSDWIRIAKFPYPYSIALDMHRLSTSTGCISWCGSDVITKIGVWPLAINFNQWHHHPERWGGRIVH